jgi:penicillin-binding protein 2
VRWVNLRDTLQSIKHFSSLRVPTVGPRSPFHVQSRRQRALVTTLLIVLTVLSLGAAFFRAQILRTDDFLLRSDDNRLRVQPIPAPRGTILDRYGEVIAQTVPSYSLMLEPAAPDALRERLETLAPVLELDSARMNDVLRRAQQHPDAPVLVEHNLSFERVSKIEETRALVPGIKLETTAFRHYPEGEAVAHLVGYVAEISRRELEDSTWAGYRMGQHLGKAGIERSYERHLGGQPGERYVEVDARGRIIRFLGEQRMVRPVPGQTLHLTLDLELQRFAHRIFPRDKRGAVVALEPGTGEVLALYSFPTYDPNLLTGGVEASVWRSLNDDVRRPLLNRATDGRYPPGSTWKLATAIIGLEKGVITPEGRMPIGCSGGLAYAGRYSRCWKRDGHGSLNLAGAIAHSCNVYFYQLGIRLGLAQLAREGARLGFARRTGIDLPSERAGQFPDSPQWYASNFGWNPTPSEVMSLSIGQGPNDQTPLRMAQFFSALAADGSAVAPHLVSRGRVQLPYETDLNLDPRTLRAVRTGLAQVVEPGGTAYMSSLKRWKLYGKTGTSQNTADPRRPHAWFTGFAGPPEGEPEIAVAVIVEFGESGSAAAAPIAAKVADFYLNRKHGLATDSLQTLRERTTGRALTAAAN